MNFTLKPIIRFVLYDPIRKIVAIIFAFGLWFFVALDNSYTYSKNIRVVYTNLADSLILVDSIPRIQVTITGRGGALLSTWAAPPKARCNLSDIDPGSHTIAVGDLAVPTGYGGLNISHTIPAINIHVDRITRKNTTVTVPLKDELKDGFAVNETIVHDTVTMLGPATLLEEMQTIFTETLSVRNRSSSFITTARVADLGHLFQISHEQVKVEVKIDKKTERMFTNIPLKLIFTPNQRVTSERISLDTLIVEGPKTKVSQLGKKDITVRIRLTTLPAGDYELPALITLPEYITPLYSSPKRFRITIL